MVDPVSEHVLLGGPCKPRGFSTADLGTKQLATSCLCSASRQTLQLSPSRCETSRAIRTITPSKANATAHSRLTALKALSSTNDGASWSPQRLPHHSRTNPISARLTTQASFVVVEIPSLPYPVTLLISHSV